MHAIGPFYWWLGWLSIVGGALLPAVANADPPAWQLQRQEAGIKVYLRDEPGSKIQAFKGEVYIHSSLDSVAAVLDDIDACPLWVHQCTEARLLETSGFNRRYFYQVSDFPFPASNRDIILYARLHQERQDGSITIELEAAPEFCRTHPSELCDRIQNSPNVRIIHSRGFYHLLPLQDGRVKVTWQQHVDPGGALPAWMINQMLQEIPFKTLERLRELVKRDRYRQAQLVYNEIGTIRGFKAKNW